jgi:hypothetical protein
VIPQLAFAEAKEEASDALRFGHSRNVAALLQSDGLRKDYVLGLASTALLVLALWVAWSLSLLTWYLYKRRSHEEGRSSLAARTVLFGSSAVFVAIAFIALTLSLSNLQAMIDITGTNNSLRC